MDDVFDSVFFVVIAAIILLFLGFIVKVLVSSARDSMRRRRIAQEKEPIYVDASSYEGIDKQQVVRALERKESEWHVGKLSRRAQSQLVEAEKGLEALDEIIGVHFEGGSLTYQRFRGPVHNAYETVVLNTASLANKIQTFDGREYSRLKKLFESGQYQADAVPDDLQEERWKSMQEHLDTCQTIVASNDAIIAELKKLEQELATLDTVSAIDEGSIIDELDELAGQVKYYGE